MAKGKKLLITECHLTSYAIDANEFLDCRDTIYDFITKVADEISLSITKQAALTQENESLKIALHEFICNAIDSFADVFISGGPSLLITLVVREIKGQLQITLKDNGKGFSDKPKQQHFPFTDIKPTQKEMGKYLGGMGEGCKVSNKMLTKQGFTLFAKNRKSTGAAIVINTPYSAPKANL